VAAHEGIELAGQYGAVGAIRERLDGGAACDVIVLTQTMIAELAAAHAVLPESVVPLGTVFTGVAVAVNAPLPLLPVDTTPALQQLLTNAPRIYFPDAERSTAGIHFMKVLVALGLADSHRERFATYPNGATAMRAMADASATGEVGAVGVTQCSEILYTEGVRWLGPLPSEFKLGTVYAAAIAHRASNAPEATRLLRALAGEHNAALRRAAGFEVA
jgi:molybdate transport system substrate-binding protein